MIPQRDGGRSATSFGGWLVRLKTNTSKSSSNASRSFAAASPTPFGPGGVIESVLALIGGERVIEGYDRLIEERPFEGAQFLRYARDRIEQTELERAAAAGLETVAERMRVPLMPAGGQGL